MLHAKNPTSNFPVWINTLDSLSSNINCYVFFISDNLFGRSLWDVHSCIFFYFLFNFSEGTGSSQVRWPTMRLKLNKPHPTGIYTVITKTSPTDRAHKNPREGGTFFIEKFSKITLIITIDCPIFCGRANEFLQ